MLDKERFIKYLDNELERTIDEIKIISDKISEERRLQKDTLAKSIAVGESYSLIKAILSAMLFTIITIGMVVNPINLIGIFAGLFLDATLLFCTVHETKTIIENRKILKGTNYSCSDYNKLWYESLSFARNAYDMEIRLQKLKEHFNECYATLTEIAHLNSNSSTYYNDDIKNDLRDDFEQFVNQRVDYCDVDLSVSAKKLDINKKMIKKL